MKKFYLLLLSFVFVTTLVNAQYVAIDSNFAKALMIKYPSCIIYVDPAIPISSPPVLMLMTRMTNYALDTTCNAIRNVDSLDIHGLNIQELEGIEYFAALKYLDCSHNIIVYCPALPEHVTYLNYSAAGLGDGDPFVILPILPDSLTYFDCSNNLSFIGISLPALPSSLTYLNCSNDGLYSLPALPNTLTYLDCSGQADNTLELDPTSLSSLPSLPNSLKVLKCNNNAINSLPALPGSLTTLDCSNEAYNTDDQNAPTPTLFCLPVLPATLTSLSIDTTITCLPNLVPGLNTNLPVCNPTNDVNHCQGFPVISGNIFYDNNSNGIQDAGELYKANVKVQLTNGIHTKYSFTNGNGYYEISPDSIGSYTLSINAPAYYNAVPASINYNFGVYDTTASQQNIALQPIANVDSLQINISPYNAARPGSDFPYVVTYSNAGTTTLLSNIILNYNNTLLIYDSSSNSSVINNGNNISLAGINLLPGQSNNFIADFSLNPSDIPGQAIFTNVAIISNATIATDTTIALIRGSYDPNDKEATSSLTPHDVASGKAINYTIHFQNTGNDIANNIVIADTLSNLLDVNSLQVITSSSPCKVTMNGNVIFFEFLNVLLPDSNANEAASHGFVSFSIKPQSSVNSGSVNNTASIYFDYNAPVVTNTATTLIQDSNTVVPVTLLSFTALTQAGNNTNALLYWSTADELNTKSFVIEQSIDGTNFTSIASATAKGQRNNNYTYNVTMPAAPVVYYRLKMIDIDGQFTYSVIAKINIAQNVNGFIVLTNPAKDWISIKTIAPTLANTNAKIINSEGVVVKSFALQQGIQNIDVSSLAAGFYYIQTQLMTEKVVISR